MIKRLVPQAYRVYAKLLIRNVHDLAKGSYWQFARVRGSADFDNFLSIKQALGDNEQKRMNLEKAGKSIERLTVLPGEIFSFWRAVGAPKARRGFVASRSIVNGKIESSVGGGVCQLSGMIYFLSLRRELEIMERHPHSMDIYTEEERFTPLGSDATVVYGYKDLRIRNNTLSPMKFLFSIQHGILEGRLLFNGNFEEKNLEFRVVTLGNGNKQVSTVRGGRVIDKSNYVIRASR